MGYKNNYYVDNDLTANNIYHYKIVAYDFDIQSKPSDEICFSFSNSALTPCIISSNLTLANFPQPFLHNDGQLDTMFVVGRSAAVDEVIGVADILASLQRTALDTPFPTGIVTFDDTLSESDYNRNIIIVGGMCANRVAANIYGNPVDCTVQDTLGVGKIELIEHNGYKLLIHGYTSEDTTRATQVLANWNYYSAIFNSTSKVCVTESDSKVNVYGC